MLLTYNTVGWCLPPEHIHVLASWFTYRLRYRPGLGLRRARTRPTRAAHLKPQSRGSIDGPAWPGQAVTFNSHAEPEKLTQR